MYIARNSRKNKTFSGSGGSRDSGGGGTEGGDSLNNNKADDKFGVEERWELQQLQ